MEIDIFEPNRDNICEGGNDFCFTINFKHNLTGIPIQKKINFKVNKNESYQEKEEKSNESSEKLSEKNMKGGTDKDKTQEKTEGKDKREKNMQTITEEKVLYR